MTSEEWIVKHCKVKSKLFRIFAAEFLGTMILAGLNVAVAHQMSLYGQESSIQGPLAGGLSVAIGIYVAANASGGHVNPAVTLAFWSLGRLGNTFLQNTLMLFWYWGAQISGAFVSSIIVYLVYYDAEMANYNADSDDYDFVCLYCTCPTRLYELNKGIMFFDQIVGTAVLMLGIMAMTDSKNANPGGVAPLCIGLTATAVGLTFGANAGGAINPARDFGPRLFAAMVYGSAAFQGSSNDTMVTNGDYFFWIPIAGPCLGALIGCLLYTFLIGAHWPEEQISTRVTATSDSSDM